MSRGRSGARMWRTHYPEGGCDYCGQLARIGEQRACRLCLEQARMVQEPGRGLDLAGANKHEQQLFLANMSLQRPRTPRLKPQRRDSWKQRDKNTACPSGRGPGSTTRQGYN